MEGGRHKLATGWCGVFFLHSELHSKVDLVLVLAACWFTFASNAVMPAHSADWMGAPEPEVQAGMPWISVCWVRHCLWVLHGKNAAKSRWCPPWTQRTLDLGYFWNLGTSLLFMHVHNLFYNITDSPQQSCNDALLHTSLLRCTFISFACKVHISETTMSAYTYDCLYMWSSFPHVAKHCSLAGNRWLRWFFSVYWFSSPGFDFLEAGWWAITTASPSSWPPLERVRVPTGG